MVIMVDIMVRSKISWLVDHRLGLSCLPNPLRTILVNGNNHPTSSQIIGGKIASCLEAPSNTFNGNKIFDGVCQDLSHAFGYTLDSSVMYPTNSLPSWRGMWQTMSMSTNNVRAAKTYLRDCCVINALRLTINRPPCNPCIEKNRVRSFYS